MLGTRELLDELEARQVSRADMARALKLPPPRITELYNGTRQLKLDEAKRLVETFRISETGTATPVLSEPVARLLVLHVAAALADRLDPDDERLEGLAQDLQAFSQFARDHEQALSPDAARGFLRGRRSDQPPLRLASRTRNGNR